MYLCIKVIANKYIYDFSDTFENLTFDIDRINKIPGNEFWNKHTPLKWKIDFSTLHMPCMYPARSENQGLSLLPTFQIRAL